MFPIVHFRSYEQKCPKSLDKDKRQAVAKLYEDGKMPVMEICQMFKISKPTLYKYVKQVKESSGAK